MSGVGKVVWVRPVANVNLGEFDDVVYAAVVDDQAAERGAGSLPVRHDEVMHVIRAGEKA